MSTLYSDELLSVAADLQAAGALVTIHRAVSAAYDPTTDRYTLLDATGTALITLSAAAVGALVFSGDLSASLTVATVGAGALEFPGTATLGITLAAVAAGTLSFPGTATATVTVAQTATGDNGIFANYHTGDAYGGAGQPTFARASTATYFDVNGVLQTAGSGVLRDGHYLGGVLHTLHEPQATNVALWCRDLTNAAWAKTTCTAAHTQTGIDGAANSASLLTATAINATCLQAITLASSLRQQSAYVKRAIGTGTISMTTDGGATWTAVTVTASWALVTIPGQTLANPSVGFKIATSGDAIAIDYVQNEGGYIASTPILTTTTAVTRAADNLQVPVLANTHSAGVEWYIDHTDQGVAATLFANQQAAGVGTALPALSAFPAAGGIQVQNADGVSNLLAAGGANPVYGHRHEWRMSLRFVGSTGFLQSAAAVNGGAEVAGAEVNAASNAQSAWGGASVISFPSVMPWALRHVLLVRGDPSTMTIPTLRTLT